MSSVGTRVGAILSADQDEVNFLGYGVYEGEFVPDVDIPGFPGLLAEMGIPNPRIRLDSGETVYGCECWWGEEDKIREKVEDGRKVNHVSVADFRSQQEGDEDE